MKTTTRRFMLGLLIAILCVALTATAYMTFNHTTTANGGGILASAAILTNSYAVEEKHNHTWAHEDAGVQAISEAGALSGGSEDSHAYYYLSGDITGNFTVDNNSYVELCLNGNSIDGNNNGSVISVNSGATFVLYDCCIGEQCEVDEHHHNIGENTIHGGVIHGGVGNVSNGVSYGGGVYVYTDATFIMTGGTITDNTATYSGGGVFVFGTFTMTDGIISDNTAVFGGGVYVNSGEFTMENGAISDNTVNTSGGGVYVFNGEFTMESGKISGNTASKGNGGGVDVTDGGTFTMKNGTITGNTGNYGGGARILRSTFTMIDGEIFGNTATSHGAGVYLAYGEFTMENGAISGNTAVGGGGVYVGYDSTITMSIGEISGNTADYGGGVYVESGAFTMGNGVISDNTANSNGGGVYVYSGSTFTMSGGTISGNTASKSGGGVYVEGKFTMSGDTISGNTASSNGGGVYVRGEFTMEDGTIGGEGEDGNAAKYGGGVYIYNGCTFTMKNGAISGNKVPDGNGGGVFMSNNSALTMENGAISGNSASNGYGGGVYVYGCTFTMENGVISDNTAGVAGGVEVDGGTFTMKNGTISGNTAVEFGGGVDVYEGVFEMSGGIIIDNTADYAGGIYVEEGSTFTMTDGTITENTAQYGGGVYVDPDNTFTMESGTITENTAQYGGGVYVCDGATFNLSGAPTISGNGASNLYFENSATANVTGKLENNGTPQIGITLETGNGIFTTNYSVYNNGVAPSTYFFADDGLHIVILQDSEACLHIHSGLIWITDEMGDETTPRTQSGVCAGCEQAGITRTLVLDKLVASARRDYVAKETALKNVVVTAFFVADDESQDVYTFALSPNEYTMSSFDNGMYLTVKDTSVTFSYTLGNVTKTATVEIIVTPLPDKVVGDFSWGWHEGQISNTHSCPTTTANATFKYYKDEACTDEYTGVFDESTPAGTYYVRLITDDPAYEQIDEVIGSFTIEAHVSDEGKITRVTSCAEDGIVTYSCVECKAVLATETIAKPDHVSDEGKITKVATCAEEGVITYSCVECKSVLATEMIAKPDHEWDNGKVTKAPTATEDGVFTSTCEKCGATKTATIPAMGVVDDPTLPNPLDDGGSSRWFWWISLLLLIIDTCVFVIQIVDYNKKKLKTEGGAQQ